MADWREVISALAPTVGVLASKGHGAAVMRGYQREQQAQQERQRLADQEQQKRQDFLNRFVLEGTQELSGITDPIALDRARGIYESLYRTMGGTDALFGPEQWALTPEQQNQTRLAALSKALDTAAKSYSDPAAFWDSGGVVRVGNETMPVRDAGILTGRLLQDDAGAAILPEAKAEARQRVELMGPDGEAMIGSYDPKTGKVYDTAGVIVEHPQVWKAPTRTPAGSESQQATALLAEIVDANRRGDQAAADAAQQQYNMLLRARRDLALAGARPSSGGTADDASDQADIDAIVDAIEQGLQPPDMARMYGKTAAVRAGLARRGYNLSAAQTDWYATQRHIATMNGPQQARMYQAVDNAAASLSVIDELATEWDGGNFPFANRAELALAKNGFMGPKAQSLAIRLEAEIADVTSELANVYMGGNSPTDHAMELAANNLSSNWSVKTLRDAVNLARRNLQIRRNSMLSTPIAGVRAENPYGPQRQPIIRYERNPTTGKLERVE